MSAHWVYRCYDVERSSLYVGLTNNLPKRLAGHEQGSWWAPRVFKVRATVHRDIFEARRVETATIRAEKPQWNVKGRLPTDDSWSEADYRDYLYAIVRYGFATGDSDPLNLQWARYIYREYENLYGQPLQDSRIDDYDWSPSPLWPRYTPGIHLRPLVPKSLAEAAA